MFEPQRISSCYVNPAKWENTVAIICCLRPPVLQYASIIWSHQTARDRQMIESVHNRFLKSTFAHSGIDFPGDPETVRKLEMSSLDRRRLVATLTFVYSVFSEQVVDSPNEFCSLSASTLCTRS
ncbi:hypothetical protein L596_025416 [Steinernema carpocapsae]|uniref:Uncharacterized protein n=1 Tax=Steinernema carpocapsae TaxID=34508 RepID=A0A4U5M7P3_STECR|nr:hypothetical protein L596_025416 [Steinernema carpocapsae]